MFPPQPHCDKSSRHNWTEYYLILFLFKDVQHALEITDTIDSLLLEPVQRFPKYTMLIRDARKTYKKDGEDLKHKHMDDLSEIIDEIAKYADNMVDVGYIMKFDVSYSALQKTKLFGSL